MAKAVSLDENNVVVHCCYVSNEDIFDSNGEKIDNMLECICKKKFGNSTTWIEIDDSVEVSSGYIFDESNNKFLFPKPDSSWILNEIGNWIPPFPKPELDLDDNQVIQWNFDANNWEIVTID